MKTLLTVSVFFIFLLSVTSCSNMEIRAEKKQNNIDALYQKYKKMITEEECMPCADCAALALAMKYGSDKEITIYKQKLIKYNKTNDTIPCPELVGELASD